MKKGFTLIELLVVVLIIGILAAIALPTYMKAVEKSRATEAITLLKNLMNAEAVYFLANGEYTDDLEALDITLPNISEDDDVQKVFTNNFIIDVAGNSQAYGIALRAERRLTGDRYYLFMRRNPNGNEALWCTDGWGSYLNPPDEDLGNGQGAVMCKTIANGNKKGVLYNNLD